MTTIINNGIVMTIVIIVKGSKWSVTYAFN
jgi:hypothetical protein